MGWPLEKAEELIQAMSAGYHFKNVSVKVSVKILPISFGKSIVIGTADTLGKKYCYWQ